MSFISKIKKIIGSDPLEIHVFSDELCVYIWESRIPISVCLNGFRHVLFDTEMLDANNKLDFRDLLVIVDVMKVLEENFSEIKEIIECQ